MSKVGDTICEDYWMSDVLEFSFREENSPYRFSAYPSDNNTRRFEAQLENQPYSERRVTKGCGADLVWGVFPGEIRDQKSPLLDSESESHTWQNRNVRASKQKALQRFQSFTKKARITKNTITLKAQIRTKEEIPCKPSSKKGAEREQSEHTLNHEVECSIHSEIAIKRRNSVDTQDESEDYQNLNFLDFDQHPRHSQLTAEFSFTLDCM